MDERKTGDSDESKKLKEQILLLHKNMEHEAQLHDKTDDEDQEDQLQALRRENQQLQKENELLKRYVEPEVLESVAQGNLDWIQLGGASAEVSVMFIDVRNFTPMSEKFPPEIVVEILNRFLEIMSDTIMENGGTLDKFIGDAVMCFWGAPFPQKDYVLRSVMTAVQIMENIKPLAKEVEEKYHHSLEVGIGIQCGTAVVGNIGTKHRLDFTVIGDVVNTAARLESNAKEGDWILISQNVYEQVKDKITVKESPKGLQLKGKQGSFQAYSVLGLVDG